MMQRLHTSRQAVRSSMQKSKSGLNEFCWNSEQVAIERASTPSQQWYTNPEINQSEQHKVFKKYAQYVGHTHQLTAQRGSYFSGTVLNEPFLVIRQQHDLDTAPSQIAHAIGSYYNVCRHHASPLTLSNRGCIDERKGLQCPYHGWCYNLHGQLTKATQINGIQDFKNKDYGLLPIPHHVLFDTLIFLEFSASSNAHYAFARILQSVADFNEQHGFVVDDHRHFVHVYSRKYLVRCNWKVFVENYLDGGYHVPYLHRDLNNNFKPDTYSTFVDDYVSFQSVHSDKAAQSNGVDFVERVGDGGVFTYIYPNFMINRYGRWMDVNYVYPKNVDETYVHFDYFLQATDEQRNGSHSPSQTESDLEAMQYDEQQLMDGKFFNLHQFDESQIEFIRSSLVASHQVQVEDMVICEAVDKGIRSTAYKQCAGRYAPKLETALFQFHHLYNTDMFVA